MSNDQRTMNEEMVNFKQRGDMEKENDTSVGANIAKQMVQSQKLIFLTKYRLHTRKVLKQISVSL